MSDALLVVQRAGDERAGRRDDTGSAAPEHVHTLRQGEREVGREGAGRDVLRHAHDVDAALDRDVPHRREPAVAVVGRGGHPDLRAALVDPPPGQRHPVLPADEPTDPRAAGQLDDTEVVAVALPVEDPLVHRRLQLAVPVHQSGGPEDEQRVVERAGAVVLALVDPDGDVHPQLGARVDQPLHQRPTDVDGRRPHPAPQLVATLGPGRGGGCPGAGGIERDEALREHDQAGALRGRGGGQLDRLVDGRLGVQHGRRRLDCCHPHRLERGHGAERSPDDARSRALAP